MNEVLPGYYKYGFLSAFTTIPQFQTREHFVDTEIRAIFDQHLAGLDAIANYKNKSTALAADNSSNGALYRPLTYCLFGEFDLAVFSLIDDFSFGTKKFKPGTQTSGFKYQVNTGIVPMIEAYASKKQVPIFETNRLPRLFSGKDTYPFTGIASIKLNNAMLVGIGQDFLKFFNLFLVVFIDNRIRELEKKGIRMFYVLNENLGWNEVSVYFFGDSMQAIHEIVLEVRHLTLGRICKYLRAQQSTPGAPFDVTYIQDTVTEAMKKLDADSLLAWLTKQEKKNRKVDSSHPVIATSLNFGYHLHLPESLHRKPEERQSSVANYSDGMPAPSSNLREFDTVCINMGWKIKPGHERAADKIIQELLPREGQHVYDRVQTGKYPFNYPAEPISVREYLEFVWRADNGARKELHRHVIKFRSHLEWPSSIKFNAFDQREHYEYNMSAYKISPAQIEKIQKGLRDFPVPFTLKGQIENLISNYNDAIDDPLMYNYFLGLRPALLNFLDDKFKIGLREPDALAAVDLTYINDRLIGFSRRETSRTFQVRPAPVDVTGVSEFIQAWNKAYWNRYFHSYYFTEINDFNIEHHGGVQQILFTYDTLYKLLSKRIYGSDCREPFVNVQVSPIITSVPYYNTVNFIHLFRPSIYASECMHEAANNVMSFLVTFRGLNAYSFLRNPGRENVSGELMTELVKFEANILKHLGPRDEREMGYITEHFGLNLVRTMIADFLTYKLGYHNDTGNKTELIKRFYRTHWFLFLLRADMYVRERHLVGSWFFMVKNFRELFVRFNLVLYLFLDLRTVEELNEISNEVPSVELKPVWENEKSGLITFVVRLGEAVLKAFDDHFPGTTGGEFAKFRAAIETEVIEKGASALTDVEKSAFEQAIRLNQQLIECFYTALSQRNDERNNILIRRATGRTIPAPEQKEILTNIDFFPGSAERNVFLDPKGNIFSTSPEIRLLIFGQNVRYLKDMWDLALKIAIQEYKARREKPTAATV